MALNVDDVFMGLRPRTAVGRAFATGRPRRRTIPERSARRPWLTGSATRSRRPGQPSLCREGNEDAGDQ